MTEAVHALLQLVLHPDQQLGVLLQHYGSWVYGVLFLILFCETGLVVTPFLPGDSLLFVAGALWAATDRPVEALIAVLLCAALCGDNCNYWIGRKLGRQLLARAHGRLINREALARTEAFYARHGGKTVVIARFIPIVRTFTPFVAGLGSMTYVRFLGFSVFGALLWVGTIVPLGYWFGNVGWIRTHFGLVTLGIIALSLSPALIAFVRHRIERRHAPVTKPGQAPSARAIGR
jgi:membrane-associated protein